MKLQSALNDVKRSRGDPCRFPGERRSTAGLFSGLGDRLVHVAPDGSIRDYSYPLSGLVGIERSRFGVEIDGTVYWLEEGDQRYIDGTTVVETVHEIDEWTLRQYDVTVGTLHLTYFELETGDDAASADATIHACLGFAPEGRVCRTGQLRHDDAVEIYHDRERDYVTASTPLEIGGQVPPYFEDLLDSEPTDLAGTDGDGRYEETRLSPIATAEIELTGHHPSTTVATLLTDAEEDETRAEALERVRAGAADHDDRAAILEADRRQVRERLPDVAGATDGRVDGIVEDLRALSLLRASNGARIAGPEFDPFFRYSGGYGYTWFRDDAEIAGFLLAADREADLGLEAWHRQSARFYVETQLADGTWPHRVWAHNGEIAPGWANGRLEGDAAGTDYQADQTASVATFLATYLRVVDDGDNAVREALLAALDGLDATLAEDGLPERVQNAWENMTGRFTHTAATYLEAYAAIARAPIDAEYRERAAENARAVYDAIDRLWVPDRECYALRLDGDEPDERLDGSTFALASAHAEYAALEDATIDDERIERLVSHLETTLEGLYRDPDGPIEGLARFEDDPWRVKEQAEPKVWTVTTAWGAHAAAEFGELLAARDHEAADAFDEWARDLLALVEPGGTLRGDGEYLPEQFFDDGTPDSATPLGWPHALRLTTAITLEGREPARVEEPLDT
ncbi:glycoside hydrolase family 15 protein [Halopiger xanaduensis]|uniref:Glucan 14-alpha-glucosidase n=1 Tax=Halopiger xanaduensis (strain DSM 18323 / JCM 14033 / SH-6) TaxID=797210 RepID=F8D4W7_HALXS|nr:glycoside hydrolase family 15 protein [Halopiger xanaduensis]AEH38728.1 glucan 14-alpha-glucosidase [Halopiger xanaduensis SH-6]